MTYTSRGESYKALFTGDLGSVGEKELLKDLPEGEPYDLLKAGHHGSKTSSSEELLARIRPRAAVISCGFHNSYGHPHRETLERLEAEGVSILRTDEMGAVEVLFDKKAHAIIYSFFDPDKLRRSDHK